MNSKKDRAAKECPRDVLPRAESTEAFVESARALYEEKKFTEAFDAYGLAIQQCRRDHPNLFKKGSPNFLRAETLALHQEVADRFSATQLGPERYEHFLSTIFLLRRAESVSAAHAGDVTLEVEKLDRLVSFFRSNATAHPYLRQQAANALRWSYKLESLKTKALADAARPYPELANAYEVASRSLLLLPDPQPQVLAEYRTYYLYFCSAAYRYHAASKLHRRRGWPDAKDIGEASRDYRHAVAAARLMLRHWGLTGRRPNEYREGHSDYLHYLYYLYSYRLAHIELRLRQAGRCLDNAIRYAEILEAKRDSSIFPGYFQSLKELKSEFTLLSATRQFHEGDFEAAAEACSAYIEQIPRERLHHWRSKNVRIRYEGIQLLVDALVSREPTDARRILEAANVFQEASRAALIGKAARSWAALVSNAVEVLVRGLSAPGKTLFDALVKEALLYLPIESSGADLSSPDLKVDPFDYLPEEFSEVVETIVAESLDMDVLAALLKWYLDIIIEFHRSRYKDFQRQGADFIRPLEHDVLGDSPTTISAALESLRTLSGGLGPIRLARYNRAFAPFPRCDWAVDPENLPSLVDAAIDATWNSFFPHIVQIEEAGNSAVICRRLMRSAKPARLEVNCLEGFDGEVGDFLMLTPRWKRFGGAVVSALADGFGLYHSERFSSFAEWSRRVTTDRLEAQLRACVPGHAQGRAFEDIVRDVLERCLVPPLGPSVQPVRTGSSQSVRDAIFPNLGEGEGFWKLVYDRHDAFGILVGAKNSFEVGAEHVGQLGRYLQTSGMTIGRFGILVGREHVSSAAKRAQANLLRTTKIMVLVLTDSDLLEMLRMRRTGLDPSDWMRDLYTKAVLGFDGGARKEAEPSDSALKRQIDETQADPVRILHLSDLHFTRDTNPDTMLRVLLQDIRQPDDDYTAINSVEYLVISGDMTDKGKREGFEKARQFVETFLRELDLPAHRCIFVPGNHDVQDRADAYEERQSEDGSIIQVRHPDNFPKRFLQYSDSFFRPLLQRDYPLSYVEQGISYLFPETGIQFLSLNSAWEIDKNNRKKAGIHRDAVSGVIAKADEERTRAVERGDLKKTQELLRIGVWHHAVAGTESMQDLDFMTQLQRAGMKVCLHGDVHESRNELFGYRKPGIEVEILGAGSFGSEAEGRPESTPRLYNLLEVVVDPEAKKHTSIRVHTRERTRTGAAWQGYYTWESPKGGGRVAFFDIDLT